MISNQTIHVGDCVEVVQSYPDQTFDVVVTSPPYNLGIKYNSYTDDLPRDSYLKWLSEDFARQIIRVLKNDGSFFLNVGSTSKDPWLAMEVGLEMVKAGFILQNNIVWVKSISINDITTGHFKPLNSKRYLNHNHESIFHFTKSGNVEIDRLAIGVPFTDKSNIARRGHSQDKRCAGNIWYIGYETVQNKSEKFNHPAGYPIELATRCLKLHGGENLKVLDPFMGTGTTLVAAHRLGHSAVGIDIDPIYAETAKRRLEACDGIF